MRKLIAFTAISIALAASPALAGNLTLKNAEGTKLRISCTGGGCKVTQKAKGGKWATVERTAGGTENYNALSAKYKGMGFN